MSSTTTARQRKAHVLLLVVVHFSLFSLSFSLSLSPRVVVSRGKAFKRITKEKKKAIADLNWNDVESVLKVWIRKTLVFKHQRHTKNIFLYYASHLSRTDTLHDMI